VAVFHLSIHCEDYPKNKVSSHQNFDVVSAVFFGLPFGRAEADARVRGLPVGLLKLRQALEA
jgi:hypothetical protein